MKLLHGDCLELLRDIPDASVDLVLTDPPYNIGVTSRINNKTIVNAWDKSDDYVPWCLEWLRQCERVLKPTGVLYMFHNDIAQISELICEIKKHLQLELVSFCVWDKGDTYRPLSWANRKPDGATALRSWFNVCEYCLHFFKAPREADAAWGKTGLERIYSNPGCFKPLKDWYKEEMRRLGLTEADIAAKYTEVTGKKPFMLRHYFRNSQFEIPTREVYESVYVPLGFQITWNGLNGYEALRQEYEALRNVHNCDAHHCNIWHIPPIPTNNRYHTCQKPVELLERLCKVSSPPNGVVLDPFMGSGSTGVACVNTGRDFIGIEKEHKYFEIAERRIEEAAAQMQIAL